MALGGELDSYEFEGPDRAEFLQDLAEFQLAAVRVPCSNAGLYLRAFASQEERRIVCGA